MKKSILVSFFVIFVSCGVPMAEYNIDKAISFKRTILKKEQSKLKRSIDKEFVKLKLSVERGEINREMYAAKVTSIQKYSKEMNIKLRDKIHSEIKNLRNKEIRR